MAIPATIAITTMLATSIDIWLFCAFIVDWCWLINELSCYCCIQCLHVCSIRAYLSLQLCYCVLKLLLVSLFFFSSRRRHTSSLCDWSSDVCSSDLFMLPLILTTPTISGLSEN